MRKSRRERILADMKANGIVRTDDVAFGRPRFEGTGTPIVALIGCFLGGDSIDAVAKDYRIKPKQLEDAIRFFCLWPKCDLPSFWRNV